MSSAERRGLVSCLLLLSMRLVVAADEPKAASVAVNLAAADELCRLGKFADAETGYRALLKTDSKLVPAEAGLIRAMLNEQKIDEALDTANAALAEQPNSAALMAAKGDVEFRRGEMSDAEKLYFAAERVDPREVRAHLGLALLYNSYSLHRKAYDHLQTARSIAPEDPAVQLAWIRMLPREQKLAAMTSYFAAPSHQEEAKAFSTYVDFLKSVMGKAGHVCRLVSNVEHTETKLEPFSAANARRSRAIALTITINDQKALLPLDTGATGIVLGKQLAETLRLPRISAAYVGGWGDRGPQNGYRAVADRIRIGELEFQDCVVVVADIPGADGLIGTDVFERYIVDIDLAQMQLRLSPLPKRPEELAASTSLNSEGEEAITGEKDGPGRLSTEQNPSRLIDELVPKDRYIAPQMADWTRVFRFRNLLLVPTTVNDSEPLLFLVDTGSVGSMLSLGAGRTASKVRSEDKVRLKGLSGSVNSVYSSRSAKLRFGHLEQKNKDILTIDLSNMSRQVGTEISGVLGFQVLMMLDVKLDYRDGLADFEYDPKARKR
ncbi:MAG: aspartyl protease family protein [Candidatus Sulfotelmatobacter sp.]